MARILIIDDSAYLRFKLRRMLEAEDYELLEADNGRKGLEMAAVHKPDCVLLDLLMPEMDGVEVLQILHDQGADVPVLVLTADIQETTRQQCLELGATAFINKPVPQDILRDAIATALASKGTK